MECWHCNEDLIWGGDLDDDREDGTELIVTNLSCSNDECDTVYIIYHTYNKEKEGKK